MERVSVAACADYDENRMDAAVERHFAMLDPENRLIRPGARVVIKPNLVMRRPPEDASTTHPAFVAAIVRAVQKRGGVAVIAESPGGPYTRARLRSVYEGTGMAGVAEKTGALLNVDTGSRVVKTENAVECPSFEIIDPVADADVVISAAKLKTHAMMGFSGAVKNLFGSVPGLQKPEFHYRFPDPARFGGMIVDLCETVRPALAFLDGVVGMEGDGPTGGKARKIGVTLASLNPHALDLLACALIGFSAEEVPTLRAAVARGLCPADAGQLEIVGDDPAPYFLRDYRKPKTAELDFGEKFPPAIQKAVRALLTPRPRIRKNSCVGCGKCAESCPTGAARVSGGKAGINYAKCIRCYCCHEMCPYRAVDIRRLFVFR